MSYQGTCLNLSNTDSWSLLKKAAGYSGLLYVCVLMMLIRIWQYSGLILQVPGRLFLLSRYQVFPQMTWYHLRLFILQKSPLIPLFQRGKTGSPLFKRGGGGVFEPVLSSEIISIQDIE